MRIVKNLLYRKKEKKRVCILKGVCCAIVHLHYIIVRKQLLLKKNQCMNKVC